MLTNVDTLIREALDYAAEQYGPQRTGEKVWNPHTYDHKLIELVVKECVKQYPEWWADANADEWSGGPYTHIPKAMMKHFGVK